VSTELEHFEAAVPFLHGAENEIYAVVGLHQRAGRLRGAKISLLIVCPGQSIYDMGAGESTMATNVFDGDRIALVLLVVSASLNS
jgi:hypothetical protein